MVKSELIKYLDKIDEECRKHKLPPYSWIVEDIPGRPNSTKEQKQQVYEAEAAGKYNVLGVTKGLIK